MFVLVNQAARDHIIVKNSLAINPTQEDNQRGCRSKKESQSQTTSNTIKRKALHGLERDIKRGNRPREMTSRFHYRLQISERKVLLFYQR